MGYSYENLCNWAFSDAQSTPEIIQLNPKYSFLTGIWGGGTHKELEYDRLILNCYETFGLNIIKAHLETGPYPIRVLDDGAMLRMSMIIIGYKLKDYIKQGQLELYSSDYEPWLSRDGLIIEAERRLSLLNEYNHLQNAIISAKKTLTDDQINRLYFASNLIRPLVHTRAELDFIEGFTHLVHYRSEVDISELSKHWGDVLPFHLIHDYYGGLDWVCENGNYIKSVREIFTSLNQQNGTIMTDANLNINPELYDINDLQITKKPFGNKHGLSGSTYYIYTYPNSPANDIHTI